MQKSLEISSQHMWSQQVLLCVLFIGCVVCTYEGKMVLVHANNIDDCQPGGFVIQPGYSHDCSADDVTMATIELSNYALKLQYQERGGWIWYYMSTSSSFVRVSPHGSETVYTPPYVNDGQIIDWCLVEDLNRLFYVLQVTNWQGLWPTTNYYLKGYDYEANTTVSISTKLIQQVSYDLIAKAIVYRSENYFVMADPMTGATLHQFGFTPTYYSFLGNIFAQNYTVWTIASYGNDIDMYRIDFLTSRETSVISLSPEFYSYGYGIEFVSIDYSWVLWRAGSYVYVTSFEELADGTPVEKSTGIMSYTPFQGIYIFPLTDISQNQFMIDTASCNLAGRVVNGSCQCDSFNYGSTCGAYCSPSTCVNGYCDYEGTCVCNTGYYMNSTNQCTGYAFPNFPTEFATTFTLVIGNSTASNLSWKRSESENAERYDSMDNDNVFLITDAFGDTQTEANGVACSITVYSQPSLSPIIPDNSFLAGSTLVDGVNYDIWQSADGQVEVLVGLCANLQNQSFPYMITNYKDGTVQTFNFTNTQVLTNNTWIQIPPFCQDCENNPNYCITSTPSVTISHTSSYTASESRYTSASVTPSNTVTTGLTPTLSPSQTQRSVSPSPSHTTTFSYSTSPSVYEYNPYNPPYPYYSDDDSELIVVILAFVLIAVSVIVCVGVTYRVAKRNQHYQNIPSYSESASHSIQVTGAFVPAPGPAPAPASPYSPSFAASPSFSPAPSYGPTFAPAPSYGASGAMPDDY